MRKKYLLFYQNKSQKQKLRDVNKVHNTYNATYIQYKETKQMIEDITKSQNSISIELCQKFLESVTGRGHQNNTSDVKILKNNLLDLVHDGIAMAPKEREEYASRGTLQKTMVDFFSGIDKARLEFRKAKVENIKQFFEHIWENRSWKEPVWAKRYSTKETFWNEGKT